MRWWLRLVVALADHPITSRLRPLPDGGAIGSSLVGGSDSLEVCVRANGIDGDVVLRRLRCSTAPLQLLDDRLHGGLARALARRRLERRLRDRVLRDLVDGVVTEELADDIARLRALDLQVADNGLHSEVHA